MNNENLSYLENALSIAIHDRGNKVSLSGDGAAVGYAETVLNDLWASLKKGGSVGTADIDAKLRFLQNDDVKSDGDKARMSDDEKITISTKRKEIKPRSPNQAKYLKLMQTHEMVFGLGPAGTGKTYLAVAMGVAAFLNGDVERLIFTRPAVEAGENLGFLPGDMKEKVDPYLRPIYDALHDMIPMEILTKKMESGEIEIAPLAFMRGRTLSNAFVILDEAQNATTVQMKMFLTRIGERSRMVVTGDLTQTDLPKGMKSGLRDATETLEHVEEIAFHHFTPKDVVRHKLVSKIVDAYENKKQPD
ncbi:MAG: phosphate starvation-inducible protein PhoH [Alphaproteobacteria bacterium]|nr:phosphate starvation-inducible protein PhoH [Alphaproteobacteria bacterium]